jgi:hypothetical protein
MLALVGVCCHSVGFEHCYTSYPICCVHRSVAAIAVVPVEGVSSSFGVLDSLAVQHILDRFVCHSKTRSRSTVVAPLRFVPRSETSLLALATLTELTK